MLSKKHVLRFIILRTIGNFLVLFALFGAGMTFGPAIYLEIVYRTNLARNIQYIVAFPTPTPSASSGQAPSSLTEVLPTAVPTPTQPAKSTLFGELTGGNKIEALSPVSSQFGIIIPKIGANAPILPNVDAGNPEIYLPALQSGVAHAAGTVFPGVSGNIYLFAHSTDSFWNVGRYNAIFYLVKELDNGDEIDLFFNGVRHIYRVVNKLVVDPTEVRFLTEQTPYEQLILQTCWPPGTTLKRLLVFARPEKDLLR